MSSPLRHGRRLFELLEEQQEPFLLDVYLLENGCSDRAFSSHATAFCCPENACRRLLWLSGIGFKRRRGGILRSVLSKLVHQRVIRKALNWEGAALGNGRWGVFGCLSELRRKTHVAEFRRLSSSGCIEREESNGEVQWKSMEDPRQLSPVSVLELHSDGGSPSHNCFVGENPSSSSPNSPIETKQASWAGLEELLGFNFPLVQGAQTTKKDIHQPHQLLLDNVKEEIKGGIWESYDCLHSENTGKIIKEQILSWEKQIGEVAKVAQLVASDFSESKEEWSRFMPERSEIGIKIESVIFEEIREETVFDMLDFHCTLET